MAPPVRGADDTGRMPRPPHGAGAFVMAAAQWRGSGVRGDGRQPPAASGARNT
jgi:hypothetical protein